MNPLSLMLIGIPDSGKTNYLARFWEALRSGSGQLEVVDAPDIAYVEEALAHLLQGKFAPRSEKNIEESRRDFVATLRHKTDGTDFKILVPDITGELWKGAVETLEMPEEWMSQLSASSGALLFVRVLSDQNVDPLDWVTARDLLKMKWPQTSDESAIPTQVVLCELVRFLQLRLKERPDGTLPRVAVAVTAWDLLDAEKKAKGPAAFVRDQYPLFAGRLEDSDEIDVQFFGVSIVGGDLESDEEFRNRFFENDLNASGYVVVESNKKLKEVHDLTLPVAWLAGL